MLITSQMSTARETVNPEDYFLSILLKISQHFPQLQKNIVI